MNKTLCSLSCQQSSYFELLHGLPSYKGALWTYCVQVCTRTCSRNESWIEGVLQGCLMGMQTCEVVPFYIHCECIRRDQPSSWADDRRRQQLARVAGSQVIFLGVWNSFLSNIEATKNWAWALHQNFPANAIDLTGPPTTDIADNSFGWG